MIGFGLVFDYRKTHKKLVIYLDTIVMWLLAIPGSQVLSIITNKTTDKKIYKFLR